MFTVLFILAIALFVAVHEFGHLVAARLTGMKATAYFIGFGPKIWSFKPGETEYGLRAILLGGYVKVVGMNSLEEVDPADSDRSFRSKPLSSRIFVLVAGVVMNFLIALLLIGVALAAFPVPLDAQGTPVSAANALETNEIAAVVEGSAAQAAGVQVGDRIVSVNGQPVSSFIELRTQIRESAGERVRLGVERDGSMLELTATLPALGGEQDAVLGVAPVVPPAPQTGRISLSQLPREATIGQYGIVTMITQSAVGLGQVLHPERLASLFGQLDGGERSVNDPISVVGVGQIASTLLREGELFAVLFLMAHVSVLLGLLNILPVPPLDGGQVVTNSIEDVIRRWRRRRNKDDDWSLDPRVTAPIAATVFAFLLLVGVTAIVIDLMNPASQLLQ
jgi:membrane-associated protease RseP (regulator of RpoE activity)